MLSIMFSFLSFLFPMIKVLGPNLQKVLTQLKMDFGTFINFFILGEQFSHFGFPFLELLSLFAIIHKILHTPCL